MKFKSANKWKIIQSDTDEYILLSDSNCIKKIKGKNASDIISVLLSIQNGNYPIEIQKEFSIEHFKTDYIDSIEEWLLYNKFIETGIIEKISINIIGEFAKDRNLIDKFTKKLPDTFVLNKIYNLTTGADFEDYKNTNLTLVIAPFFYNKKNIHNISKLQQESQNDFLFVELYSNGIALGPLMNIEKETVCLNCLEKRRIFNCNTPKIIIENLLDSPSLHPTSYNVFDIGNFDINCNFIYNELTKYASRSGNQLYNKSIFIDFSQYQNQYYEVLKAPNCEICNDIVIYNPL